MNTQQMAIVSNRDSSCVPHPTMRASIVSAGLVPAMVMLLAGISATVAQLGDVKHREDHDAGHFKVLGPRAANYGEPSDYGYVPPPPYGEETSTSSATSTTSKTEPCG